MVTFSLNLFRHSFTSFFMVSVFIFHYLLYNLYIIEVIFLSKKKAYNNNKDIYRKIENNIDDNKDKSTLRKKRSYFGIFLLIITIILSIIYFVLSLYKFNSLTDVIRGLLILLFSLLLTGSISGNLFYKKKTKL